MEQTLLNEIVARVAAKLAEAEGGEAAPAAADRDDREGLLLLSQEMNDTCRAMLKCEKLKARFRVDCASLQSEPAELDSYGVVVLTGLTNEALAKLALGLCDTPYTRLAAQAILAGKRVYIPTEEVELYRYASTAPAAPSRWPVMDLVELTARRAAWSPNVVWMAAVSQASFIWVEVPWALI